MRKICILFVCTLLTVVEGWSQTFTVDNITYTIEEISSVPRVLVRDGNVPDGNLVIPNLVSNGGINFRVSGFGFSTTLFIDRGLTSVTLSDGLLDIANNTFRDNNLTTVTIPRNVTFIGFNAFSGNDLTEVRVKAIQPPSIQSNSFGDRSTIDLIIPSGTTDAYLDEGWTGFNSITEDNTVFISGNFFYEITGTNSNTIEIAGRTSTGENVTIPSSILVDGTPFTITSVGAYAFEGRINPFIRELSLPNTITTIKEGAFQSNALLTLTLPSNLETVSASAFRSNNILSNSVTIPENVTSIGKRAFDQLARVTVTALTPPAVATNSFGNPSVIDLTVPLDSTDAYQETGWVGFKSISEDLNFAVSGFELFVLSKDPRQAEVRGGPSTEVLTIPGSIIFRDIEYSITAIGQDAFEGSEISTVVLPSTLTTIKNSAFRDNSLETLTIPDTVTEIGGAAFMNNQLSNVNLPQGLTEIQASSFRDNLLENIIIPDGVVEIGNSAFENNELQAVQLSNHLIRIEDEAFRNNALTTLLLPNSIEELFFDAFRDNLLETVTLSERLRFISDNVFRNNKITSITLPEGLTSIGGNAFRNNLLTSVTIPNSVVELGSSVFQENQLTSITLPEGLTEIPTNGFADNLLTSVVIPGQTVLVEGAAFRNNQITTLTLSSEVNLIRASAFQNNRLTEIEIPSGVSSIGSQAFSGNPDLTTIVTKSFEAPSIQGNTFGDRSAISVTVPTGTISDYEAASWINFESITEDGSSFIQGDFAYAILSTDPNTVELIGMITDTTTPEIPDTVTDNDAVYTVTAIAGGVFEDKNLTSVVLPSGLKRISSFAFLNNVLTTITFPEGIEDIGFATFTGNQLESVLLPDSVSFLGFGAFAFNEIASVQLSQNLEIIKESTFANNKIASLEVPSLIRIIEQSAFINNEIASLTLVEGIEVFGLEAFGRNLLESVTIPASVTRIGPGAFFNNLITEVITESNTAPAIFNSSFGNHENIDVTVPDGTREHYLTSGWDNFRSLQEVEVTITVAPKVFLQGASLNPIVSEENLMRDSLRENGLLPTTSPYGDDTTVDPTVFNTTGANAIVDWVLVELREGPDNENTTIVATKSALLQRDGDIVGLDGTSSITFTEEEGNYFIAIRHRNHIGVLAAVPATLSSTVSTLDFTQDPAFAKGGNLALTEVNGTFAMIAGDADGSSQILNTDITEALGLAGGGESYSTADADMNGFVLNSDIQLLILSNSGTVQQFE